MEGALKLLLIAAICSYNLVGVEAEVVQRWDKPVDEHFILKPNNSDKSSNTNVGFSQKIPKNSPNSESRDPRTIFIPLGNWFNKPWKRPATTITTTTPAVPNPGTTFDEVMLETHNAIRRIHNVPPLRFNPDLKAMAELCVAFHATFGTPIAADPTMPRKGSCASTMTVGGPAESITNIPLPPGGFGTKEQLIFQAISSIYIVQPDPNWAAPVYSQFNKQKVQIIWKSTTDVGCAVSYPKLSPAGEVYISCIYNPPGNELTQDFKDNVQRPIVY